MSKSVLHYRRRFQSLAGDHAAVRAWKEDGVMYYHIACQECFGSFRTSGNFHTAMRSWAVHTRLVHPGFTLPNYAVVPLYIEVDQAEAVQRQVRGFEAIGRRRRPR
jgi:hypothetical protein